MRTLATACVALFASGCLIDISYEGTDFLCADMVCADGFECVGGTCVLAGTTPDGGIGTPDADSTDAAPSAPVIHPFAAPTPIAGLNTPGASDDDLVFRGDMLEAFWCSDGGSGLEDDVYTSVRQSTADPWPTPVLVPELSSPDAETTLALSRDGLTIVLGSDRVGTAGGIDLWISTRDTTADPWTAPTNIAEINAPRGQQANWIADDGLSMIYSDNSITNNTEFYLTERDSTGAPFGPPTLIPGTASGVDDSNAMLHAGELVLTFASDRAGGAGGSDFWVATRASTADPFSAPMPLPGSVNTANNEQDFWMADNLCYLTLTQPDTVNGGNMLVESTCQMP